MFQLFVVLIAHVAATAAAGQAAGTSRPADIAFRVQMIDLPVDVDGDGDRDVVTSGKTGLFLSENMTTRARPLRGVSRRN
jgi:hypothetical protein